MVDFRITKGPWCIPWIILNCEIPNIRTAAGILLLLMPCCFLFGMWPFQRCQVRMAARLAWVNCCGIESTMLMSWFESLFRSLWFPDHKEDYQGHRKKNINGVLNTSLKNSCESLVYDQSMWGKKVPEQSSSITNIMTPEQSSSIKQVILYPQGLNNTKEKIHYSMCALTKAQYNTQSHFHS